MSIDIIIKRIIIHHAGQDKGSCHQPGASPVTSGAARHPHPQLSLNVSTPAVDPLESNILYNS